jgi:hypothetical protein
VLGAEPTQLGFAVADLLVQLVDQQQASGDGRAPRLGKLQALEQRPAAGAE